MKLPAALYIHIPFCKSKCLYCDFPSFSCMENLMEGYSIALARDIRSIGDTEIKTIFIGGGTPTYLSLKAWQNISKALSDLNLGKNIEFTVEGNPGTFTEEKLKFLKGIGVNRLSIGLQAWQDDILKRLGRIHTLYEFLKSYKLARKLQFSNINIDLMFGLPGQNISEWKDTLKNVIYLNPEHISCYSLIVEEGTPFYDMYEKGELNLPEEDEEREMYDFAVDFLGENGYKQYEISNFSKKGMSCKHNLVYWNLQPYIGCGVSANSYLNGCRYRKCKDIEQYIQESAKNDFLKFDFHRNSVKDDMEEFIFMGLRKIEGISMSEFKNRFNTDIYNIYESVIDKHIRYGTLIKNGDRLYLSKRGIQVSNSVMCEFILTA